MTAFFCFGTSDLLLESLVLYIGSSVSLQPTSKGEGGGISGAPGHLT
jgi:hypothetical protein